MAAAVHEEAATGVEGDAGRPAGHGDRQGLLVAVAGVQGARTPPFIGDPPRPLGAGRKPPGVDELSVGAIRDERVQGESIDSSAARRARRGERRDDDGECADPHVSP